MPINEQNFLAGLDWNLPPARNVLVFAPHPDDEIFGCGGTLSLLCERGVPVTVVIATDGALYSETKAKGISLAERRMQESSSAARIIGYPEPIFWKLPDCGLVRDESLVGKCLEILWQIKPDLVFVTAPTEWHPDHIALAHTVVDAVRRAGINLDVLFYEIAFPLPRPNLIVDITPAAKKKSSAMQCFMSQLKQQPYDKQITGLNLFRAYYAGPEVLMAESFVKAGSGELINGLPPLFEWPLVLRKTIADYEQNQQELNRTIADHEQKKSCEQNINTENKQKIARHETCILNLQNKLNDVYNSRSWKSTAGLRFAGSQARKIVRLIKTVLNYQIKKEVAPQLSTDAIEQPENFPCPSKKDNSPPEIQAVPYYINSSGDNCSPEQENPVSIPAKITIAIHIHLLNKIGLEIFIPHLHKLPCSFSLYISTGENVCRRETLKKLQSALPEVEKIVVKNEAATENALASLIISFGKTLLDYDFIAHLQSNKIPVNLPCSRWEQDVIENLLGDINDGGRRVAKIIELLQTSGKLICPQPSNCIIGDKSDSLTRKDINGFSDTNFLESGMFWARTECLRDFLTLPVQADNLSSPPFYAGKSPVQELSQLLPILANYHSGDLILLCTSDSIHDYKHYENQEDYSASITHKSTKILSFYLPQFYRVPENDLWHGQGFTEWSKVKSARPLFAGHYQQHIPHPDIGYYRLDNPDILKTQAELMKSGGVHGQIFYHYWFSGKLILEKPARLLLDNPEIRMPFCFCWANENWTRKWDGSDDDILLSQDYSPEDAHAFISYLIPFFHDPRYIRVKDRPLLFIYRPSSIVDPFQYLHIWEKECLSAGLARPYVVAVLTREAKNPRDYGMDGGAERVLHDWTGWTVPEMKHDLQQYTTINGTVLSYDQVADFYMEQTTNKKFPYFRSLLPGWDNTPRYDSDAYIVHGNTPAKFQQWLEHSIDYTEKTLPAECRFVLINAWNEWAEGTHLEPDTRFGYSWLNSIGRAMADISYGDSLNAGDTGTIKQNTEVEIFFSEQVLEQFRADLDLKKRFLKVLSRSTIFAACSVSFGQKEVIGNFPDFFPDISDYKDTSSTFRLYFQQMVFFNPLVLEKMLANAVQLENSVILPNNYRAEPFPQMTENGSVDGCVAAAAPLIVYPPAAIRGNGCKNFRIRCDACTFPVSAGNPDKTVQPGVAAIIRVHKSDSFPMLANTLTCLSVMEDCLVLPYIAAQDLSAAQITDLEDIINACVWADDIIPQVSHYSSPGGSGDLRAEMMNSTLKKVAAEKEKNKIQYAAFLDCDDLLMPHAYRWLINRLRITGKAVALARIYTTHYNESTGVFIDRCRCYEESFSYDTFKVENFIPLHGILFDLKQLDISGVKYFPEHRFMEDYYLTLQLISKDNADWEGLAMNVYIGDYLHSVDNSNTLALTDDGQRQQVIADPKYQLCLQRIKDLQKNL